MSNGTANSHGEVETLIRRHLRFGWWYVLIFLCLGIALETLHGFKVSWYLDVANETRRLTWRLAHAHGVLVGLVNIAFAVSLRAAPELARRGRRIASPCLAAAGVLFPGGFLLGGLTVYGGDPGPAILLVPVGALLLLVAVLIIAWGTTDT